MDGYVNHAYVGNRTVIDIDEKKSTFEATDGKISGKLEGTLTKEYSGKTDTFNITVNPVSFSQDFISPIVVFESPTAPLPDAPDYYCNKDYAWIKKNWRPGPAQKPKYILVDNKLIPATIADSGGSVTITYTDVYGDADNLLVKTAHIIILPNNQIFKQERIKHIATE